jgi:hypothetical protein
MNRPGERKTPGGRTQVSVIGAPIAIQLGAAISEA